MIDLAQVSLALRGATSQSLIVLDEFGKGTTSADGAGLLAGSSVHADMRYVKSSTCVSYFLSLRSIITFSLSLFPLDYGLAVHFYYDFGCSVHIS